jgi:hypothetical protein
VCEYCGYAFWGRQTDATACLASIERSVRTIKYLVVWWFVLMVGGALIGFAVAAARSQ